jgi:hypothetical protein
MPRKKNNQESDILDNIDDQEYQDEDEQEDIPETIEEVPKKRIPTKAIVKKRDKNESDAQQNNIDNENILPPEIKDIVEKNDKMNFLLTSEGYEVNVIRFMTGKQGKKDFIWKDNWMETPLELHEIISAINGSGYFNLLIRPKGNKDYFQTKYFPFNVTPEDYAEAIRMNNEKKQMANVGNMLNSKPNPLNMFGGSTVPLNHFNNNQYSANDLSYALLEEIKEMRKELIKKPDDSANNNFNALIAMNNEKNNKTMDMMITLIGAMVSKNGGNETASIVKAISDQAASQYQALTSLFTVMMQTGAGKSGDMQSIETAMNIIGKAKDFSGGVEGGGIMDKLGEGLAASLPQLLPLVMNNNNKTSAPNPYPQPIPNPINNVQQMDDNTLKSIVSAINILNEKVEMLAGNNTKQIPLNENVNSNIENKEQTSENKGEDMNFKLKMAFGLIRQATKRNDLDDEMILKQLEDIKDEFISYSKTECSIENKNETIDMIEMMADDGNVMADLLLSMINDNQEGMLYPLLTEFNMDSDIVGKIKDIVEYYKTLPIEEEEIKGEEHVKEEENKN